MRNRALWFVFIAVVVAILGLAVYTIGLSIKGRREGAFVQIGPAEFVMGSREAGSDARPHVVHVDAFGIGSCEVTVSAFADYLNGAGIEAYAETPQITREANGWMPCDGTARKPVGWVSMDEAQAYCRWLSGVRECDVRLPSEAEWEYAARGGIQRARYPWGWGGPEGRACFGGAVSMDVASFEPNPFGLYDMAGNVFEWCVAEEPRSDQAVARGGSWAETDPRMLCVYRRTWFPRDYRDGDVGFRVIMEELPR